MNRMTALIPTVDKTQSGRRPSACLCGVPSMIVIRIGTLALELCEDCAVDLSRGLKEHLP